VSEITLLHEKWMQRAIVNALKAWGHTSPNPHVGAVIVRDNKLIADGWHHKAGTNHAEKDAIANASGQDLKGSTIYVTLEPCCTTGRTGPCTQSIIDAGISRVIYGCTDTNPAHAGKGFKVLKDHGIEVIGPILEKQCLDINKGFFKWINTGKPYVILKMASTLDGKIATASGHSQWITGPDARAHVQYLRQGSDAIMVGGETALVDDPSLTVRELENPRQPKRFIWTRKSLTPELKACLDDDSCAAETCSAQNTDQWNEFLKSIGKQNISSLLLEGGGWLASNALRCGIVDEVHFFIAPKILGGANSRSSVSGEDPLTLDDALDLENMSVKPCGKDFLFIAYPKSSQDS
jgi:diaminohydroxyphosphoribosylaminopyrimidine deaminase / 5-amino-6-(5-phosphoribosylamino)uracil reductase